MSVHLSAMKISLMHRPYNAYYAEAFGLIFKLAYHLETKEHPWLDIFLNDDEAKQKEWKVYGTLLDEDDERYAIARFDALGEEWSFQICTSGFWMGFDKFYTDFFTYPDGSTESMTSW